MLYAEHLKQIASLDAVLHNPARLMIVFLLSRNQSWDYLSLMRETNLTSGNLTTHLNKLLAAGYVDLRKGYIGRKPNTAVALTAAGLAAYKAWGGQIQWALPEGQLPQFQPLREETVPEEEVAEWEIIPEYHHFTSGADYQHLASQDRGGYYSLPEKQDPGYHSAPHKHSPLFRTVSVEPIPDSHPLPAKPDPGYQPVQHWSYSWVKHNPHSQSGCYFIIQEGQLIKILPEYYLNGHFLAALEDARC